MAPTIVANSAVTFRQKNPVAVSGEWWVCKTCRRNASHLHHAPGISLPALFQLGELEDAGISPDAVRGSGAALCKRRSRFRGAVSHHAPHNNVIARRVHLATSSISARSQRREPRARWHGRGVAFFTGLPPGGCLDECGPHYNGDSDLAGADRAPGGCRAGEGPAWRRTSPALRFFRTKAAGHGLRFISSSSSASRRRSWASSQSWGWSLAGWSGLVGPCRSSHWLPLFKHCRASSGWPRRW